ncbi:nuclear transport factor 2 family protein [Actinoplanes sp. NPDC049596]|uniref:nuclear transport factor 2 family protein n=1 Tax=unclassified Actinoplanes TaxID=2626549 RepID=UPI003418CEF3
MPHGPVAHINCLERHDWPFLTTLLDPDVVYGMPRPANASAAAYLTFNTDYPSDRHLRLRRIVADGSTAALLLDVQVGAERQDACVWLDVSAEGLITRIADYRPEPYEPPTGREHLVERYGLPGQSGWTADRFRLP